MNRDDETTLPATDGPFMRAAAVLADLDSPLYAEERERDVWNEASAVGFQFLMWTVPLCAAVGLWVGGRAALPYVGGMLLLWAAASLVALTYASRLGVNPSERGPLVGRRAVLYVVLVLVLAGGLARAFVPVATDPTVPSLVRGFAQGGLVGLVLGAAGTFIGIRLEGRRKRAGS